jgi:hypothetical protein
VQYAGCCAGTAIRWPQRCWWPGRRRRSSDFCSLQISLMGQHVDDVGGRVGEEKPSDAPVLVAQRVKAQQMMVSRAAAALSGSRELIAITYRRSVPIVPVDTGNWLAPLQQQNQPCLTATGPA